MSTFAVAGFPVPDEEAFEALAGRAVREGASRPAGGGATLHEWADDTSGAGIVCVTRRRALECTKPVFRGAPGATLRAGRWIEDPECPWCPVLGVDVLEDGAAVHPAFVAVLDLPAAARAVRPDEVYPASLTLFAEKAGGDLMDGLATRAAIPTGMFGGSEARILISGEVLASERRTNALTGEPVGWARVASLGAEYDVLLPDPPAPGTVMQASGWLMADLRLPHEPHRRRWWRA
jgi:hypothetical protein